jgi:hypothetical protein
MEGLMFFTFRIIDGRGKEYRDNIRNLFVSLSKNELQNVNSHWIYKGGI